MTTDTDTTQTFEPQVLPAVHETASAAVAAQAKAAVESRYKMALARPRDWDDVRTRLLKACRRPGFASVARYHKPIGKGVEGPSIRFAEEALRAMGNVMPEVLVVYDDDEKRIVRVAVTDLEANLTYSLDVVVNKTVERRVPKQGQEVLRRRTNSEGKAVCVVRAEEDDLLNKQQAMISKAMRTSALRLLPGDILEEAMDAVRQTLSSESASDPDAERKRMADAFSALGVRPSDLARYLGHPLEQVVPAELTHLRAVYQTIRDGEASWADYVEQKEGGKTRSDVVRDRLDKSRKVAEPAPPDDPSAPTQAELDAADEEAAL